VGNVTIFHSDESNDPTLLPGWYIGAGEQEASIRQNSAMGPYGSRREAVEACIMVEYGQESPDKHRAVYRAHCDLLRTRGQTPPPYLFWLRVQIGSENECTGRAHALRSKQDSHRVNP
jgi:hypothetical protein